MFENPNIGRCLAALLAAFAPLILQAQGTGPNDDKVTPPPVDEAHELYAAVWHAEAERARLLRSDDPPSFAPQVGFRLTDIQVWLEDGDRKYLGVFRPAEDEEHLLVEPLEESDFEQEVADQLGQDHCLSGFEIWNESGQVHYSGVFRPAPAQDPCTDGLFEVGLSVVEFNHKLQTHGASHHLVDFETVVANDQLRISALWQRGAETSPVYALLGVSWGTFHEWTHDLTQEGHRLVDLDIQIGSRTLGGEQPSPNPDRVAKHEFGSFTDRPMISGIWRVGTGMDWLAIDFHWDEINCAHNLLSVGFEDSGLIIKAVDDTTVQTTFCKENEGAPILSPGGQVMRLAAIEAYTTSLFQPLVSPTHFGVLHNSGSSGPP
ncbi:MAG: hypothetical protein AAF657_15360 [Acidobacteriota bacterium]